jgi:outer membrane immunogenic protein
MRRSLLVLLAATSLSFAVAQSASAADLPLPPVYKAAPIPVFSWTGFYVGLNGGGGWGQTDHTASATIVGVPGIPALTTGNFNVNGGIVGGTLGYNYQVGQWVLGAETDLNWSNLRGTFNGTILAVVPFSLSSQLNWLDTTRVRVGWAYDRALFYGTAGGAMGGLTASASATGAIGGIGLGATLADTQTRFGWTAGAGIEYAVTNNISAKLEYLYVDLGSQNQILLDSVKFTTNIVRGGVNLKF